MNVSRKSLGLSAACGHVHVKYVTCNKRDILTWPWSLLFCEQHNIYHDLVLDQQGNPKNKQSCKSFCGCKLYVEQDQFQDSV